MSAPADKRKEAQIISVDATVLCPCRNAQTGAQLVTVTGRSDQTVLRGDCSACGRVFVGSLAIYVVDLDEL